MVLVSAMALPMKGAEVKRKIISEKKVLKGRVMPTNEDEQRGI